MNIQTPDSLSRFYDWLLTGNRPLFLLVGIVTVIVSITLVDRLSQPETCQLFDGYRLSPVEKNEVLAALGETDLTRYEVDGSSILVPADQKGKFLAAIAKKDAMPLALTREKEYQPNPFLSRSQIRLQQLEKKKKQICQHIKRLPFVSDARFEFDRDETREFMHSEKQTAIVVITPLENRILDRQQLESVQRIVASSFAGIEQHEVAVVDTNAGITYDDIRNQEQALLLHRVNWQRQRREHYERVLINLFASDFPGIEVTVQVQSIPRKNNAPTDARQAQSVTKLAAAQNQPIPCQTVGLNTTQTVSVAHSSQPPVLDEVRTAVFHATLPHATRNITDPEPLTDLLEEKIRIKITVPNEIFCHNSHDESVPGAMKRFETIREQISSRINASIPESVLSESMPIEIVPRFAIQPDHVGTSDDLTVSRIKQFWPLGAFLFVGVLAVLLFQSSLRKHAKEPNGSTESASDDDLEAQLTALIDNDPAAAARVLKQWIQQEDLD